MQFGISYPARPDAWKDVVVAEDQGFTHAWFYDAQTLYSAEKYVDETLVRMTLTGRADEIISRLKALEVEGLKQVAIQVVKDGRTMIEEFSRDVIAKY